MALKLEQGNHKQDAASAGLLLILLSVLVTIATSSFAIGGVVATVGLVLLVGSKVATK